jgi:hypothetical protein
MKGRTLNVSLKLDFGFKFVISPKAKSELPEGISFVAQANALNGRVLPNVVTPGKRQSSAHAQQTL